MAKQSAMGKRQAKAKGGRGNKLAHLMIDYKALLGGGGDFVSFGEERLPAALLEPLQIQEPQKQSRKAADEVPMKKQKHAKKGPEQLQAAAAVASAQGNGKEGQLQAAPAKQQGAHTQQPARQRDSHRQHGEQGEQAGGASKGAPQGMQQGRAAAHAAKTAPAPTAKPAPAHTGKGRQQRQEEQIADMAGVKGQRKQGSKAAAVKGQRKEGSKTAAAAGGGPISKWPFPVDFCDHFETGPRAVADIAPALDVLASRLGKTRAQLAIYDPVRVCGVGVGG